MIFPVPKQKEILHHFIAALLMPEVAVTVALDCHHRGLIEHALRHHLPGSTVAARLQQAAWLFRAAVRPDVHVSCKEEILRFGW